MLHIYNSLTRKKDPFTPITPGKVRLYVCGMTVYDFCHLGHTRAQVTHHHVEHHHHARMPEMAEVVHRHAADIQPDLAG